MPKTTEELYKELIEKGNSAQQKANDILTQIDNRPAFQYDAASDPLYQSYKNQYVHQGKRAMEDTMGQAAGLTGGYGSTYSQSVGNQAYNEYLTKLNSQIPVLAQQARSAYDAEGQRMMDRYNLALNEANTAYAQGRDALGDMRYDQEYADKIAYQDWQKQQQQKQWDYNVQQDTQNHSYNLAMQMIQSGQVPDAGMLQAAGIDAAYAKKMASWYARQLAGAGGGRSYSRSPGSQNPRYRDKGDKGDPNQQPETEPPTEPKTYAPPTTAEIDAFARRYAHTVNNKLNDSSDYSKAMMTDFENRFGADNDVWTRIRQWAIDRGYIRGYKNAH